MKKGFFKKLFATPTVIVFSTHVLVIQQLCPLFPPIWPQSPYSCEDTPMTIPPYIPVGYQKYAMIIQTCLAYIVPYQFYNYIQDADFVCHQILICLFWLYYNGHAPPPYTTTKKTMFLSPLASHTPTIYNDDRYISSTQASRGGPQIQCTAARA